MKRLENGIKVHGQHPRNSIISKRKENVAYGSFRRSLSLGSPMYSASSWKRILINTRL